MELFRFPCSTNAKDHKYKWTIGIIWPRIAFNYMYLILNHSLSRCLFKFSLILPITFLYQILFSTRMTKLMMSSFPYCLVFFFSLPNVIFCNIAKWEMKAGPLFMVSESGRSAHHTRASKHHNLGLQSAFVTLVLLGCILLPRPR